MASASCAPCAFGASTSTIALPFQVVQATLLNVVPRVFTANGSLTTSLETSTIFASQVETGNIATSLPIQSVNHTSEITISTLGTVLTYGTEYVSYYGFSGVAATAPTECAQTLPASTLALPQGAGPSLIYPDPHATALPAGLVSYLDGAGFGAQLNNDPINECAPLGGPTLVPVSTLTLNGTTGSISISVASSASTSTLTTSTTVLTSTSITSDTTVTTDVPPPTTYETSVATAVPTSAVVPTSQTITYTPVAIFSIATASPVSGTSSFSIMTPQGLSLGTTTSSSSVSADVGGFLSLLGALTSSTSTSASTSASASALTSSASSASSSPTASTTSAAVVANGTTSYVVSPITASPPYPGNGTNTATLASTATNGSVYTIVPFTGAANKVTQPLGMGWYEAIFGLAMPVLLW